VATLGGLLLLSTVSAVPSHHAELRQRIVIGAAATGAAWMLGLAEGRRMGAVRSLERAAADEARSRQQVVLAREVHDAVGHALGVISAEAGVSLLLPDTDEQELRETLADIEQRARSTLGEIQTLVRSLRNDRALATGQPKTVDEVIAGARRAGLRVDADLEWSELSPEVEAAMIRVVQESLSNVIRHADAQSCRVAICVAEERLVIDVEDDGRGISAEIKPGLGLAGMRERAAELGGSFSWSSGESGGTRVAVRLPVGTADV
jgi:signal transduction histidine kinase